jgi:hypothetical protein
MPLVIASEGPVDFRKDIAGAGSLAKAVLQGPPSPILQLQIIRYN